MGTKNSLFMGRREVLSIQDNNGISLLIPKNITEDSHFSNYAVAVYCILQALHIPSQLKTGCVTVQQLAYYLTNDTDCFKRRNKFANYIQCGLNELLENNIISKIGEYQKHYILDCSNLWINTENDYFSRITFEDIRRIFKISSINNFLLLRYYIVLIGTISNTITVHLKDGKHSTSVVGNLTLDYLSELTGISMRSVIEYNKILEKNELLHIYRHEDFTLNGEKGIRRLSNVYGRPCDKEYIDAFAESQQKYYDSHKRRESSIKLANSKRKFAQMYHQLIKGGGKNYTKGEIIDIYNYVISENKKYERMYEKNKDGSYLDKIRNIDVFEKFDFIKNNNKETKPTTDERNF